MPERIKADDFIAINPLTGEKIASGREELVNFGFDPDLCKIMINDDAILSVEQEGLNLKLACSPRHWRRVQLDA